MFSEDDDFALALQLQESWKYESPKKPSFMDVTKSRSEANKKHESMSFQSPAHLPKSTSLIDPQWEYIDPTPDVHAMFLQFNKRFFWGTLLSVEVRWSPRMTSCAGVCCYEGRGGLCSIRLSAPLLKLRPRKDLVETLLHEMIHAYLFITNNDRDRDGHGPNFHNHMNRINKEAGTKISVYHNFHEEVKLYQQHWWRCEGPCQKRPPFFGMVKRSMNRPPGPTDFWFASHQATCGGKFVKIREPENFSKKKEKWGSKNPSSQSSKHQNGKYEDIRSFINGNVTNKRPSQNSSNNKPLSNVNGLNSLQKFHGGTKMGGSSSKTITVMGKQSKPDPKDNQPLQKSLPEYFIGGSGNKPLSNVKGMQNDQPSNDNTSVILPFTGQGHVLGSSSIPASAKPWLARLDKLENNKTKPLDPISSIKKRPSPIKSSIPPKKSKSKEVVSCPCCNKEFEATEINCHLDVCVRNETSNEASKDYDACEECNFCHKKFSSCDIVSHRNSCISSLLDDDSGDTLLNSMNLDFPESNDTGKDLLDESEVVLCPMCSVSLKKDELDQHLETCVKWTFANETIVITDSDDDDDEEEEKMLKMCGVEVSKPSENSFSCPCCMKLILESKMNSHLDECLSAAFLENECEN